MGGNNNFSSISSIFNIFSMTETDSTNNEAKRQIANGNFSPSLYIAEGQTNGRGRMGRSFYSPKGEGIYMTIALPFNGDYKDLFKITPAAAVAVCKTIEKYTLKKPLIKWVNDVYIEDKKVCGILCESVSSKNDRFVIIGIGINVSNLSFPGELSDTATSLNEENLPKEEFICFLSETLLGYIKNLPESSFMDEYRERSLVLDKKVSYIKNGVTYSGTAKSIDESGALFVVGDNGEKDLLSSGEITLRINNQFKNQNLL